MISYRRRKSMPRHTEKPYIATEVRDLHGLYVRSSGVSEATVRRALPAAKPEPEQDETTSTDINDDDTCGDDADDDQGTSGADQGAEDDLPLLPPPADRGAERAAARWGKLPHADPVFTPAARVPLAGLLLAIPALQT